MTIIYTDNLKDFINIQITKSSSRLLYGTGAKFEGPYQENQPCGFGKFTWFDDEYFEGFFQNGVRNKIGFQKWYDEDMYIGEFFNDKKHGWGVYKWSNNDKYEGSFYKDARHGFGTYTSENNNKYVGTFYKNKREGFGTVFFSNGDIFQGLYKDNYCCGPGIFRHNDGRQDIGLWHRSSLLKLLVNKTDVFTIENFRDLVSLYSNKRADTPSITSSKEEQYSEVQDSFDDILKYELKRPQNIFILKDKIGSEIFSQFINNVEEVENFDKDIDINSETSLDEREDFEVEDKEKMFEESFKKKMSIENDNVLSMEQLEKAEPIDPHLDESRKQWIITDSNFPQFLSSINISNNLVPVMEKIFSHITRFSSNVPIDSDHSDMMNVVKDVVFNVFSNPKSEKRIDRITKYKSPGNYEQMSDALLTLSHFGNLEEIRKLLMDPVAPHVNVTDCGGSFPLIEATLTWNKELINYLLDCGANINHITDEGISALGSCMLFYYPRKGFIETIAETVVKLNQTPFNYNGIRREHIKNFLDKDKIESTTLNNSKPSNELGNHKNYEEKESINNYETGWNEYQNSLIDLDILNNKAPLQHPINDKNILTEENDKKEENILSENNSYKFDSYRNYIECPIKVNHILLEKAASILSVNNMIINRQLRPTSCNQEVSKSEGTARFKALKISRFNQMWEVIQLLLRRGANPNICQVPFPAMFFAVKSGDVEMTRLLISKGADVNSVILRENNSIALLHISSCLPGKTGILITEILLESGAKPNVRASEDESFLDKTLIDEWSKDRISDEQLNLLGGKTPLHLVCSRTDDFKASHIIAKLLMDYGANPNMMCNGHTALTLAIASGNDLIVAEILKNDKLIINLPLTHGLGNILCVASSTSFEHTRSIESRLNLIKLLISHNADLLNPILVGPKRLQGIVVDYAYHVFNLDQRVAHLPYHALTPVERELFNNRRVILSRVGMFTRESAVEKEKERLETMKSEGREECSPSPDFIYTGAGADISGLVSKASRTLTNLESQMQGAELLASKTLDASNWSNKLVHFRAPNAILKLLKEFKLSQQIITRKPLFKYCYECGRSVNVKLTACTRCKEVYFCSKLCKTKAWTSRHKSECLRIGGRITSSEISHKNERNVDSPTPVTIATDCNIDQEYNKSRNRSVRKGVFQLKNTMGNDYFDSYIAHKLNINPRRLPPLNGRDHPSYSYEYIMGQYLKIDNLGRLLPIDKFLIDNYSFE